MIAINTILFIGFLFGMYCVGFLTACILGSSKIGECEMNENYWRNQYFLEKESHKGSIKKYLNTLKEADQTIAKLSEEKANLLDSVTYYKEAK